ncbi:MAG: DUF3288 family protein [Cyanobacteria bacterium WB6_1B_304]|jgi:hypothetical protein|nr:DUF3288 family protein [Cyanobacteria bacterium WB6_1B_304]
MEKNVENQEQIHPLWAKDRKIVDTLLNGQPSDFNRVELARLLIRYQGFPGARDIQHDLEAVLKRWQLNESELFEQTRKIHGEGHIYRGKGEQSEDWS